MFEDVPVIAFFGISPFDPARASGAKNCSALTPSCHVVTITTKFGKFLPNRLGGDSIADRQTQTDKTTISPRFFFFLQNVWG